MKINNEDKIVNKANGPAVASEAYSFIIKKGKEAAI